MMKKNQVATITEREMLEKLGIPDWRHMNKDCIMEFASNIQYLDPEVAKYALSQFPKFTELGSEVVSALKESLAEVCSSEDKSVQEAYDINCKILDNLDKRLNKPFLLPGERKKIIDAMVKVSDNVTIIHKQHGHINIEILEKMGKILLGVVAVAGLIISGGKLDTKS